MFTSLPAQAIWGALLLVFLFVEGITAGLASIWFALGALVALLASLLHAPIWLQIALFFIVSIATLILTRPLARKYINGRRQATNADRVVGMTGRTTETIDNIAGTGAVYIAGKVWTARTKEDGEIIPEDALVRADAIEGVKLAYRGPFFHEVVTRLPRRDEVLAALEAAGILGGLPVEEGVLWCATEKVSRAELDRAIAIVKEVLAK